MTTMQRTDAAFFADLLHGHYAALSVAARIAQHGLAVTLPQVQLRPHVAEAAAYDDGGCDLLVGSCRLQVKCRAGYDFADAADFQRRYGFGTVIVDTAEGIAKLPALPTAYVLTSADASGLMVVPALTFARWLRVPRYDPTRGRVRLFYECPLEHTRTFDELIAQLKQLQGAKHL